MPLKFVSIHGSYNHLEISLFQDQNILCSESKIGMRASSCLVPTLDLMLIKFNLKFEDLNFIAVDRGPGAFTSLRVTLASVNGLAFANKIPLVGVNGLEALIYQNIAENADLMRNQTRVAVALLNAYNNDVYFLISKINDFDNKTFCVLQQGSQKIDELLNSIKNDFENHKIFFCGQGTELQINLIQEHIKDQLIVSQEIKPFASSETIGKMAYDSWQKRENIVNQIEPLYLKTQFFAVKK